MKRYSSQFYLSVVSIFFFTTIVCAANNDFREQAKKAWDDGPVEKAIKLGIENLFKNQNDDGSFGKKACGHAGKQMQGSSKFKNPKIRKAIGELRGKEEDRHGKIGQTSLAVYALLKSGVSVHDERIKKAIKYLTEHDTYGVYTIGVRCNLWVVIENMTGRKGKYMKYLRNDARRLIYSINRKNGGWHYNVWDDQKVHNSTSQYGILGTWGYQMLGGEIPRGFWKLATQYWKDGQSENGGWSYGFKQGEPRGSMSAAGLASLFVCFDAMLAGKFVNCKGGKMPASIENGLKWFDQEYYNTIMGKNAGKFCYYMYGVERVGHACGYKYFGNQDWYKLGALKLMKMQRRDGGWLQHVYSTAYALLFLAKGRNTVLFNKLEFAGDWNNRPRDIANLTHWLSLEYEKDFNWQIVNFKVDAHEWHDAPILYISGSAAPKFSAEQIKQLRTFVHQGGTLFSVTECGGSGFNTGIREVYKKMFPDYELARVSKSHPIYSVHEKIKKQIPLYTISNGVRPLVFHTDIDVARAWQSRMKASKKDHFRLGVNLSYLVLGQYSKLLPRGKTTWPYPVSTAGMSSMKVVRVKYNGNYNPEPLALEAFKRRLAAEDAVGLDIGEVSLDQLGGSNAKVAMMTGTSSVSLSATQQAQIKKFVEAGGTILIDAAGGGNLKYHPGSAKFYKSMHKQISKIFGATALKPVVPSSKLYTIKPFRAFEGKKKKPIYRKLTRKRGLSNAPHLLAVKVNDRPAVILSCEDIETGFLNSLSGSVDGYDRRTAFEIGRNIILNCK